MSNKVIPISPTESDSEYSLLPFRFNRLEADRFFLSSETGEWVILLKDDFIDFVHHKLTSTTTLHTLEAKHFLVKKGNSAQTRSIANAIRTKKSFLDDFVKLHIFVMSLRCNTSCAYCQVSRKNADAGSKYDMPPEIIRRSVDLMLSSPSKNLTLEFQGGEPTFNFQGIKEAVRYSKEKNEKLNKNIEYVVCTNLEELTEEQLTFYKEEGIIVSTSIDGPEFLHNQNRPCLNRTNSYQNVVGNIRKCQEVLGADNVSALMTTTKASLSYPKEIIDEYLKLGFRNVFIRQLNPYGFAVKTTKSLGYTVEEFFDFYRKAVDYIIELNRRGISFAESYASLILAKVLTPWPVGFVDLQSPTGNGFNVCVYNYDGEVYASDESRMLAEMGDFTFHLGNVFDSSEELFLGETMQTIASAGIAEALPGCSDCAYLPFCGADPIRHYATQKDMVGHRPTSDFCRKNKLIIEYLINKLDTGDSFIHSLFYAWATRSGVEDRSLIETECP